MPELPEVETICRGLMPFLEGQTLTSVTLKRQNLRYPFSSSFVKNLENKTVQNLYRRAKYILATFREDSSSLLIHLGMSGRFRIENLDNCQPRLHDHVIFTTHQYAIFYNDPRRFGLMDWVERDLISFHPLLKDLGYEPFDPLLTPEILYQKLASRKQPVKQALLNQQLIVGIGNIYASESLWQSCIHPLRPANSLAQEECNALLKAIRFVLDKAIQTGGSTLRDYRHPNGQLGNFQNHFKVYDQEGRSCPRTRCKGIIHKQNQGGRSTYFCQTCQK